MYQQISKKLIKKTIMKTTITTKLTYLFELVYVSNSQYREITASSYNEAKSTLPHNSISTKIISVCKK